MREQITESKMHALDYWQVIRNRWGVILLTFFLITLASLVIIALLDKKFAGRTKFQINQTDIFCFVGWIALAINEHRRIDVFAIFVRNVYNRSFTFCKDTWLLDG